MAVEKQKVAPGGDQRLQQVVNYLKDIGTVKLNSEVADRLEVSQNSLSMALHGRTVSLNASMMRRVAVTFGVSYEWLMTGEGDMLAPVGTDCSSCAKLAQALEANRRLEERLSELRALLREFIVHGWRADGQQ